MLLFVHSWVRLELYWHVNLLRSLAKNSIFLEGEITILLHIGCLTVPELPHSLIIVVCVFAAKIVI